MASTYNLKFLEQEHNDVKFLKRDDIGIVISRALSETYLTQPSKPIEFFAKYLLNHSKTQKKAQAERDRQKQVKELRQRNEYFVMAKKAEVEEKAKEQRQLESKKGKFYDLLNKSPDLSDNLDELADFLHEFTGATGVYIGKLIQPRKQISDDDDDKAHIDSENPKVIWYIHSSKGHDMLRGKILKHDQGVTHAVFNPPKQEEDNQVDDEGNPIQAKPKSLDFLDLNHHVYVKEVVREPKMHFYQVPRLGSYLAIPLVYNSCMFEDALDNAVSDYFAVQKAKEEQDKARNDYEEEQSKIRDEKEKIGEAYEPPENREWEQINQRPFQTFQESYVVCLDTLGQDREFTREQREFAIQTVNNFKQIWENTEFENLTKDRNRKIKIMEIDKEFIDSESQKLIEEEEKHIEEILQSYAVEGQQLDEELKDLYQKSTRLSFIAKLFKERIEWQKNLKRLSKFKVLKMPRVMQSIFYFLQYQREEICEKGTNKFFWKKAKSLINDQFYDRLVNYTVLGCKEDHQPRYTTLNFIEKNIEGIVPEDVDHYNMTLGKLFKWLHLAIRTRKDDIVRRKALKKRAREHREALIEQARKREEQHVNDLKDARQKFLDDHRDEIEAFNRYQQELQEKGGVEEQDENEEAEKKQIPQLPVFNEGDWEAQWLHDNPEINITQQVVEEKDNDWYMTQEEEDNHISQYFLHKESSGIMPPPKLRCRKNEHQSQSSGYCGNYVQANIVILSKEYADDFHEFCKLNPKPCPVLEVIPAGQIQAQQFCPNGMDIRFDLPKYKVFKHGKFVEERTQIQDLWQDDFVTFLIGCSFSFESALQEAGLKIRHIEEGKNVPMYKTNIKCQEYGIFNGSLVVSMRPFKQNDVQKAVDITDQYPRVHGGPIYYGLEFAEQLGIQDLNKPDYGDSITLNEDDIPVFWACGVTPQNVIMQCDSIPLVITHSPGCMLITDVLNVSLIN